MAHQLEMAQEEAFLDMECLSETETDHMLGAPYQQELVSHRSWSRGAVLAAGLIGVAVACTLGAFALNIPKASGSLTSKVVGLNEENADAVWASLLTGTAKQQYKAQQSEADATEPMIDVTAGPTEAPTEAPTTKEPITEVPTTAVLVTMAPVVAPTPAPVAATPVTAAAPASVSRAESTQQLALKFQAEAAAFSSDSAKYKQLMRISNMLTAGSQKVPDAAALPVQVQNAAPLVPATSTTDDPEASPLAPKENIGDGNPCPDDEEMVAGICYKKCSDLTGGSHTIRTSPFSCCAAKPCGPSNTWAHMGFCFGYDVSGDSEAAASGSRCPNGAGACLTDEDEFGNMCYESCASLTNNEYPHRVAAMTCCKTTGLGCFLFTNVKTDASFAAGGGKGDGNSGTPAEGHMPMTALTR